MNIRLVTQSLGAASAQAQHPPVNGSDQELVLMDFSCPAPPSSPWSVVSSHSNCAHSLDPGLGLVTPSATQFLC